MTELKVATYNIRVDTIMDFPWNWKARAPHVFNLIRYFDWDMFGVQEVSPEQLKDFDVLEDYDFVGTAREDGKDRGEYNGIFFKKDRLELIDKKQFWLSDTPNQPSIHPEAGYKRVCVCGVFRERISGCEFVFIVTHLDNVSEQAREYGSRIVVKLGVEYFKQYPVILAGDFNASPQESAYKLLTEHLTDSRYAEGALFYGPKGTYQGFDTTIPWSKLEEIDYIFVSKGIEVKKVGVLTNSWDNKYPSDHFPVEAYIKISTSRTS